MVLLLQSLTWLGRSVCLFLLEVGSQTVLEKCNDWCARDQQSEALKFTVGKSKLDSALRLTVLSISKRMVLLRANFRACSRLHVP